MLNQYQKAVPFEGLHIDKLSPAEERRLLGEIAQGNRAEFRTLYTHYFSDVQRYIMLFEPSRSSMDELTQDVFIRIWEKRSYLAGVESFKSYLFMVTRNVVFNYLRGLKVQQKVKELDEVAERSGAAVEDQLLY